MTQKRYEVRVFGKDGCDKCDTLKGRVQKLLQQSGWEDFTWTYHNVETEDGLVEFCEAECVNPQRIPAMLVGTVAADGGFKPIAVARPVAADPVCGKARLYQYLGLQTDYSESGKGVLSPKMVKAVLEEARAA